jgi:hypothetical protein
MLPIVIVIEPASVLKNESPFARLEPRLREPVRVLKNEFFSTKVAAKPTVAERALAHPLD